MSDPFRVEEIKCPVSPGLSPWAVVSPSRWDENQKHPSAFFEITVAVAALKKIIIFDSQVFSMSQWLLLNLRIALWKEIYLGR